MASKLKKMFGGIAQFALPAIGYAVGGPAGGAIGGMAGGALSGQKGAIKQGAIGGLTGYGAGTLAKGMGIPSFAGGSSSSRGVGGFLSNLFGGGNAYASQATPSFSASRLASSVPSYLNPMAGFSNPSSIVSASQPIQNAGVLNQGGGGLFGKLKDLFGNNKLLASGIGLGIGSQFIKSPKVPELPQGVIDYQNMVKGGGSAINQQATNALSTELSRPFEQVSAEEEQAVLRQIEKDQKLAEDQVRDLYRNLRPGTDPSTDSAFKRDLADVNDQYSRTKADTIAQLRRQVSNDFQGNRIRQILAAQGIDQNQMQNMLQANQYDVDRMLAQLQIDDRDKKYLRDYLLNFGGSLAGSQLGIQQRSPLEALFGGGF